ncbi:MAG: hypothetical protein LBT70_03375, partial [Holosporaceae bacterium]|nr:hypothetical protein [Holosporaceae bacterium]
KSAILSRAESSLGSPGTPDALDFGPDISAVGAAVANFDGGLADCFGFAGADGVAYLCQISSSTSHCLPGSGCHRACSRSHLDNPKWDLLLTLFVNWR